MVSEDVQVICQRIDRQWMMTTPVRARADAAAMEKLLEALQDLTRGPVITRGEQKRQKLSLDEYGLRRPRIRIGLVDQSGRRNILVGRDAPLGGFVYIKEEARSDIIATETNLLSALPKTATDLRDHRLFLGFPGDVSRLDIRRPDGLLQLARSPQGLWQIQKPMAARASIASVQGLLDRLYALQVSDFVADSVAAASLYGIDEPVAQVTLISDKGPAEQTLVLGKPVDRQGGLLYTTLLGSESVFAVSNAALAALTQPVEEFRDRRLLTMTAYDIGYIQIEEGEHVLKIVRDAAGDWMVTEPRSFRADAQRVNILLSEWTGARIETFLDSPGTNLAELGLSPPARRMVFAQAAPAVKPKDQTAAAATAPETSPSEEAVVLVSSDTSQAGLHRVKLGHEEPLYEVREEPILASPLNPLYYRDKTVLTMETGAVRRIARMEGASEQIVEAATNGLWTGAAGAPVDAAAVADILDAVQALRATDLIAEDPADLAAYGLDTPRATLTLGLRGEAGISKTVVFGLATPGGQVFAMIKGLDVVFTMDLALRDRLLRPLYAPSGNAVEEAAVESVPASPAADP
jgi:hypothetical protein